MNRVFYLHQEQFNNALKAAAIVSTTTNLINFGYEKDRLLQKTAYARFGSKNVKRWHKSGLLHPKRQNGCIYYPTIELVLAQQRETLNILTPNAQEEIRDFTLKMVKG